MERLTRSSIANIHRYFLEHCDLQGLANADSTGHEDPVPRPALATEVISAQDGEDGFDDDFDAFEEGADEGDDDFGAFDDGDDTVTSSQDTPSAALPSTNAPELSLVSSCHFFLPRTNCRLGPSSLTC